MSRLVWLGTFVAAVPAALAAAIVALMVITKPATSNFVSVLPQGTVLAANTTDETSVYGEAKAKDGRAIIIKNYLHSYESPLEPYVADLVSISDRRGVDPNLLVAIAQQESNLCKKIPPDSHNCWGFGIYGDKVTHFDSYPQAIDIVASTLKEKYIDQGLDTPEEIMRRYTPPSVEIGGPWALGIRQFLDELQ